MTETATPPLEQHLRIDARPDTVWTFWTDPARLCEWWGTAAETVAEVGGVFSVTMDGGGVMRGEYLALERPHRLEFTFGWDDGGPGGSVQPGSTRVVVTLEPDGDATLLTLRHYDLPEEATAAHDQGWGHFLPLLATAAAGPA
jgi:uncharacterized protein YndB with AHSA1/START domain